jgi:hypothetical protein
MLRYFITFPAGVHIRREQLEVFAAYIKEAANQKEWRDIVTMEGAILHDVRHPRVKPKFNRMPVR